MASTINTANIDETYPIAGQDNDSQGFRDNFQNIKTALGVAKAEITTLQDNSLDLTKDNDFNGNTLSDVTLRDFTEAAPSAYAITINTTEVDFSEGSYVRLILNVDAEISGVPTGDLNIINFTNWGPANTMGKMRLEIQNNNSEPKDIRFEGASVWLKQTLPGNDQTVLTNPFRITDTNTSRYIFDVWSANQGQDIFVSYEGKYKK
jgi:hypothetical protein